MNNVMFNQIGNRYLGGENKNVCVLGLGFVGLTLALTISEYGIKVYGIEKNKDVVKNINNKQPHFYEKGLVDLLTAQLNNGFECMESIPMDKNINTYIIAVGVSINHNNEPDFDDLKSVSNGIANVLKKGDLIILRSTVPIGTTRDFVIPILEKKSGLKVGKDFLISFAPERTVEGNALQELKTLPQVIAGFDNESSSRTAILFKLFVPNIIILDLLEEAEIIKVINNSYRDLTFAFANELAMVCECFNLSTNKVIKAANFGYERSAVPMPSPGVGGYCLTKDSYLLTCSTKNKDYQPRLPVLGREINNMMPGLVYNKITKFFDKYYNKVTGPKKLSLLGLAFKGNPPTSDIRFSPTIDLIKLLRKHSDIMVYGHDFIVPEYDIVKCGVEPIKNIEECFKYKNCLVFMNNHPDYKNKIDIIKLSKLMSKPALIIDCWSQFDQASIAESENIYYANLGYNNYS